MPALNFQARFAPLVESGEKRQTIRAYRKDGRDPKPGDTLYLYTGMRTKACRMVGAASCRSVMPIGIDKDGGIWRGDCATIEVLGKEFRVTGYELYGTAWCTRIARADGFDDVGQMRQWFEKTHGLPFEGLIIRW